MERRYCSRCLQTFLAPGPARCPREACRHTRPARGWNAFLKFGDTIDDRYRVQEILGAGGAGVTYRCDDLLNGESTAVKVLHADRKRGTLGNRLAIEGEVLELLDHPHIVPFRALQLVGEGHHYLATLQMRGGSLDGWVKRNGPLSPRGAVALGRQAGMALDYVHASGIVHRDIKPPNILLERGDPISPIIRLGDFGIARLYREQRPIAGLTRTGAFIGTPEYAAPEQVRGEKGIGPAADAFALGALLHYAASGSALHHRSEISDWKAFRERSHDRVDRPRLSELIEADDPADVEALGLLDSVIDQLMHPDASERLDMGTAAMRLGANPAQLAPLDHPRLAPPTLVSEAEAGAVEPDTAVEALIPLDEDEYSIESLEDEPGPDAASDPPVAQLSPVHETSRVGRDLGDLPDMPTPTRDTSEDLDDDLEWPTREQRRNRRHALFAVAAALLIGIAFGWPGGPAALIGEQRLASLEGTVADIVDKFRVEAPQYSARDPHEPPELASADVPKPRVRRAPSVELTEPPMVAEPEPALDPDGMASEVDGRSVVDVDYEGDHEVVVEHESEVEHEVERDREAVAVRTGPTKARLPKMPSPVEAAPDSVPPIEGWANDPDDHRTISEALSDAEREARRLHREELARLALEADQRAARYALDAQAQDARLERRGAGWEDAQRDAKSRLEDAPQRDWNEASEPPVRDEPVDVLEEVFGRTPRVEPLAEASSD